MKLFISLFIVLLSLGFSVKANADVAIVVHPSNNAKLSEKDIERIFLGKIKSFSNGKSIVAFSQSPGSKVSDEFNEKVLDKSATQLKAYWSKLVFTGKGTPPEEVESDAEILARVAEEPSGIGYVDASKVDSSVKVLATF
ncbi:substrate-binding domain-containing protein [Pleionea sediminis]|uniref:substrate-binding domain-containing protein n=1 Tax=Pleionea sediminis TaxID=2569479 RepID=UPI001186AD42|nr:substrate-binding domain-containing protein [Pleionea sediminis]